MQNLVKGGQLFAQLNLLLYLVIRWQLKSCWISSGTNTMAKHSNLPPHKKLQPWIRWCNWKLMDYKIFWHLILKESKDPVSQSQAIVRTVSTLNFLWFLTTYIYQIDWKFLKLCWLLVTMEKLGKVQDKFFVVLYKMHKNIDQYLTFLLFFR